LRAELKHTVLPDIVRSRTGRGPAASDHLAGAAELVGIEDAWESPRRRADSRVTSAMRRMAARRGMLRKRAYDRAEWLAALGPWG